VPTNISEASTDTSSRDKDNYSTIPASPTLDYSSSTNVTVCHICEGTGFVHPLLPSGKPDFSQVIPCQCQSNRLQEKQLEQLQRYSNIGLLSHLTFDKFDPKGREHKTVAEKYFATAYQTAKAFADNPEGWLLLSGPINSGKTLLACAIVNQHLNSGRPAFYIGVSDLLDHLRSTFGPASIINYDDLFEQVKNTPLLVLDDMRIEAETSWAKEKMEQLLNHRFNARLATVFTTDIPLSKFDEQFRSRLEDNKFCQICIVGERSSLYHLGKLPPGLLQDMSFNNFEYKRLELALEQRQNLQQAFTIAKDFANKPEGWLIFQGVNGCGKTHLAAAIVNYRLSMGKSSFFIFVPDLLDYLRSSFSNNSRISYDEYFEIVKESPLLILDDFGQQSSTPWAQEKLYQLINHRYNGRLSMVVTTCLSLEEIEPRISSRMVDPKLSLVYNITAPDYRGDIGSG
jgi:DNA replication protein DnaC